MWELGKRTRLSFLAVVIPRMTAGDTEIHSLSKHLCTEVCIEMYDFFHNCIKELTLYYIVCKSVNLPRLVWSKVQIMYMCISILKYQIVQVLTVYILVL